MAYDPKEPSFKILISMIKIWDIKKDDNPLVEPSNAMTISEVEQVEIEEAYSKLICKATVKFPRGTVIRKTLTWYEQETIANENQLSVGLSSSGVITTTRTTSTVADNSQFNIGQRIRIYLGYTTDPAIADYAKTNKAKSIYNNKGLRDKYYDAFKVPASEQVLKSMNIMFDGYITKVSVDSPIILECENLASELRQITCPNKEYKKCSVNTVLSSSEKKGNLNLLKETSLKLHSETEKLDLQLGHCILMGDKTVADVIEEWKKFGLYTFVTEENGKPVLQCARSYFIEIKDDEVKGKDSILNVIDWKNCNKPVIKFNYHVAQNNLTLQNVYDGFIAVEAQGITEEAGNNDQQLRMTICKNPDWTEGSKEEKYRVLNESLLSKKARKKGYRTVSTAGRDRKNNLTLYTKVPYIARKIPITRKELLAEATKYLEHYNFNGIEGTLTIFGDLHLHTGYQVRLEDDRYPNKNGYYIVESINTTFGTGGYRQTITLPYCISRDNDKNKK